jgi:hypothetical protein
VYEVETRLIVNTANLVMDIIMRNIWGPYRPLTGMAVLWGIQAGMMIVWLGMLVRRVWNVSRNEGRERKAVYSVAVERLFADGGEGGVMGDARLMRLGSRDDGA